MGGQPRSWNNGLEPQTCSYLSRKTENLGARTCHRWQRVERVTRQNNFLQVSLARIQVRSERFRSWTSSPSANPATYFTAGTSGSTCDGMGDDSGNGNNSKVRI